MALGHMSRKMAVKQKVGLKDNGCWYAFDESGSMRTGWVASHEHWYFMGESVYAIKCMGRREWCTLLY